MRFIKIFFIIFALFLNIPVLFCALDYWVSTVEHLFPSEKRLKELHLQKEVTTDNNLTAASELISFYKKQKNDYKLKAYYKLKNQLMVYCRNNENECEK